MTTKRVRPTRISEYIQAARNETQKKLGELRAYVRKAGRMRRKD